MLYVQIDEDDFIDRMNRAHESTTHGFSDDGLKALFGFWMFGYIQYGFAGVLASMISLKCGSR
jgi:hypothetical protein